MKKNMTKTKNVDAGNCRVYHKNGKLYPTTTAQNIYKVFVVCMGYTRKQYNWLCHCEGICQSTADVQW